MESHRIRQLASRTVFERALLKKNSTTLISGFVIELQQNLTAERDELSVWLRTRDCARTEIIKRKQVQSLLRRKRSYCPLRSFIRSRDENRNDDDAEA